MINLQHNPEKHVDNLSASFNANNLAQNKKKKI